ncbi:hypothetical protein PR202_gb26033 [Eleusine coracana subsp. coracana]|uniref:Retrotransposon gag domain-containing protein n=1 Tax=Eleusine coracana subsp. coracana TaxID=191504 RepID=A0AAV5FN61_ELECO|nr:hypothetical protein PR202_gb26033 [Eleusine coracana subsp. coracana]
MGSTYVHVFESRQEDTKLLRKIAQLLSRNGGCRDDQPWQSTYQDFLSTHPPTFEHAKEPLDADNFIRIIESKFGLLQCINAQKPLFAAQQLLGSANVWWANYMASLPEGHIVPWDEFKNAFCSHFIPAGMMERKLQEFLDLKQGERTVLEYSQKFNHLAQYAPLYVDSEAKKRAAFRRGMNPTVKEKLTSQTTGTFNDLVNAAIVQGRIHLLGILLHRHPNIVWCTPLRSDNDSGRHHSSNFIVRDLRTLIVHNNSLIFQHHHNSPRCRVHPHNNKIRMYAMHQQRDSTTLIPVTIVAVSVISRRNVPIPEVKLENKLVTVLQISSGGKEINLDMSTTLILMTFLRASQCLRVHSRLMIHLSSYCLIPVHRITLLVKLVYKGLDYQPILPLHPIILNLRVDKFVLIKFCPKPQLG